MDNLGKYLAHSEYKHILETAKIAAKLGKQEKVKVYIVGGVVRDIILGKKIQDIDLMVEGDGILFAKKLANIIGVKKIVLKKFLAGSDKLPSLKNPRRGASSPLSLANSAYFF